MLHRNQTVWVTWWSLRRAARHPIRAIIKTVLPPAILLVLIVLRCSIKSSSGCDSDVLSNSSLDIPACQYRSFRPGELLASRNETFLHFTPPQYEAIMNKVGEQLSLETIAHENEVEIENALKGNHLLYKKTLGAVVFSPIQLNYQSYSIRLKNWMGAWNTDRLYPFLSSAAPRSHDAFTGPPFYLQSRFLALQSAIDSHISDIDFSTAVVLQKFPHSPYKKDAYLAMVPIVFPLLMLIVYALPAADLVREITEQRALALKEFMGMNGLTRTSYWVSWYLIAFLTFLPGTLINLFILFVGGALKSSDATVILFFLIIFIFSSIALSFFISCFVKSPMSSMMWSVVIWIIFYSPFFFLESDFESISSLWKSLFCLLPPLALAIGCKLIGDFETSGDGIMWSNLSDEQFGISFHTVLIFLALDFIILSFLAIYVDAIYPYMLGYRKNWRFCCAQSSSVIDAAAFDEATPLLSRQCSSKASYEKIPVGKRVNLVLQSVVKSYRDGTQTVVALNATSIKIVEGDITVVLGPNGSGKSTLLAMMSGFVGPTEGEITLSGVSLAQNVRAAQQHISYLPQSEPLFNDMTVLEHLVYYTALRGLSEREVYQHSKETLHVLGLTPLSDHMAGTLSGGQKRKLSLALSMLPDSPVLILDEPLAGLDAENRNLVCSVLEDLKKTCTIILCSHSVDETVQIADRIAILLNNSLHCYGTKDFIRSGLGIGYTVNLKKDEDGCQDSAICRAFVGGVAKSTVKVNSAKMLTFCLPKESVKEMASLLTQFEKDAKALGIQSIVISENTLKQAYNQLITGGPVWNSDATGRFPLKKGWSSKGMSHSDSRMSRSASGFLKVNEASHGSRISRSPSPSPRRSENISVFENWLQFGKQRTLIRAPNIISPALWGSLVKNCLIFRHHWALTIAMIFLPAIFCLLMFLVLTIGQQSDITRPLLLWATTYPKTTLPYTVSPPESHTMEEGLKKTLTRTDTTSQKVTRTGTADLDFFLLEEEKRLGFETFRKQYVVAEELGPGGCMIARFADAALHSAPISLSIAHNTIISTTGSNKSLRTFNKPLPALDGEGRPGSSIALMTLYIFGVSFLASLSVVHPAAEINSGAQHIQHFSGLKGCFFWLGLYVLLVVISLVSSLGCSLTVLITKEPAFFDNSRWLYVWLVTFLYFLAAMPLSLLITNICKTPSTSYAVSELFHKGLGFVTIVIFGVFQLQQGEMKDVADSLSYIFMALPSFAATHAMSSIYTNYYRLQNCRMGDCRLPPAEDYLSFQQPGIAGNITSLIFSSLLYLTLLLCSHNFKRRCVSTKRQLLKAPLTTVLREHEGVASERHRIASSESQQPDPIVLRDLRKYHTPSTLGIARLRDLTLGVRRGETLGLLGGNGAGKTTTFKILTGQELDYGGTVLYKGEDLRENPAQPCVGYCPQFPVLIQSISVWEHMVLFSRIKGQYEEFLVKDIAKILNLMGLLEFSDTIVSDLSSGHKKKLGVSLALIGVPNILLLDEPTTGMDEEGKSILVQTLNKLRDKGTSIIVTSHNMSECEAICDRIGILSHGSLQCLGGLQQLKEDYANYMVVRVSLVPAPHNEMDGKMAKLAAFISSNFPIADIKEIKGTTVTYAIRETADVKWSALFTKMELNSDELGISDYSISQANLTQVYLSIANK